MRLKYLFLFTSGTQKPTVFTFLVGCSVQYTLVVSPDNDSGLPDFDKVSNNEFTMSNQKVGVVTDSEHVAFLLCWLTYFVFCCKTMQVPKYLLSIAQCLYEGKTICLGSFILAHLYEGLTEAVQNLRDEGAIKIIKCPLWLLQLWLNVMFRRHMLALYHSFDLSWPYSMFWFHQMHHERSFQISFLECFSLFSLLTKFQTSLAPFALRQVGPDWFRAFFFTTLGPSIFSNFDWASVYPTSTWLLKMVVTCNLISKPYSMEKFEKVFSKFEDRLLDL